MGAERIDLAELDAPYTHQELILREALGSDGECASIRRAARSPRNPVLVRTQPDRRCCSRIARGDADRAVAHATPGHCLQQNLVCVLEGE